MDEENKEPKYDVQNAIYFSKARRSENNPDAHAHEGRSKPSKVLEKGVGEMGNLINKEKVRK